jgi:F-type H+-transporting ATPase subunit a
MGLLGGGAAGAVGYLVGTAFDAHYAGAGGRIGPIAGGVLGLYALVCFLVKPKFEPKRVGIPNVFMAPLNIVGKFAEILSMCFRLFGNIFGGAIIILMIASAIKPLMPMLLQAFFGIFVGTVQAFVFAVLCLTYIAVTISEEEEPELEAEPAATAGPPPPPAEPAAAA